MCVCVWGGGLEWLGVAKKKSKKMEKKMKNFLKKKMGGGYLVCGVYLVPGVCVPGLGGIPGPWGVPALGGGGFLVHGGGRCTWSQRGVPGLGVSTIGGVPGPSRGGGVCSRGVYLVLGVYLGVYLVWGAPGGCTWSGTLPHLWTDRRL